eukprot:SAG22_NODE_46_length_24705_cov_89.861010_14_plen_175_part_00
MTRFALSPRLVLMCPVCPTVQWCCGHVNPDPADVRLCGRKRIGGILQVLLNGRLPGNARQRLLHQAAQPLRAPNSCHCRFIRLLLRNRLASVVHLDFPSRELPDLACARAFCITQTNATVTASYLVLFTSLFVNKYFKSTLINLLTRGAVKSLAEETGGASVAEPAKHLEKKTK